MLPLPNDVFFSLPLSTISLAYYQANRDAMIADQVFPEVPSAAMTGFYREWPAADWLRAESTNTLMRADGDPSKGFGYRVQSKTFGAKVYAAHSVIGPQTLAAANGPGGVPDLRRQKAEFVTQLMMNMREQHFITSYFAQSIWTTDWQGVAGTPTTGQIKQWDQGSSTPIQDIRSLKRAVQLITGYRPNVIVIGPLVWDILMEHAQITGKIQYGQPGSPTIVNRQLIASLFEVDRVLVPEVIFNSANEPSSTMGFAYGKSVMAVYAPPSPGIEVPSAGYIFPWTGYLGANAYGGRIVNFNLAREGVEVVEMEMAYDMVKVSADLGGFIRTVIA